tara:strand:- start:634 stop:1737 length:1104 start_codon:yes stop_codon:yes gene_type:complete
MNYLQKIIKIISDSFKILLISFFIILFLDFFIGKKILKIIDPYLKETEFYDKRANIWHKKFHHTFKENINMKSVGVDKINRFCTNEYGFKSNCNFEKKNYFKFGFLGDSFTEGIGLNYEDTFVGIFENRLGSTVANMGVSSYSPKLHLAKINFFLNRDLKFEHIILFLDISDYYDEAFYQFDSDKFSVIHSKKDQRRIWLRENFPFTNFYMYVLKKMKKKTEIKSKNSEKIIFGESAKRKTFWLNKNLKTTKINGKSIIKIHEETKYYVEQIYNILKEKNIKFSLAIYPWPQNLITTQNNSFYRNEWKNFCKSRCEYFFDFFKEFEKILKNDTFNNIYKKYYFWGDVHFNASGNKLIGEKLIKDLEN